MMYPLSKWPLVPSVNTTLKDVSWGCCFTTGVAGCGPVGRRTWYLSAWVYFCPATVLTWMKAWLCLFVRIEDGAQTGHNVRSSGRNMIASRIWSDSLWTHSHTLKCQRCLFVCPPKTHSARLNVISRTLIISLSIFNSISVGWSQLQRNLSCLQVDLLCFFEAFLFVFHSICQSVHHFGRVDRVICRKWYYIPSVFSDSTFPLIWHMSWAFKLLTACSLTEC